jgi:hypothetical protein
MPMLMMSCSSFSYSNTRGVTPAEAVKSVSLDPSDDAGKKVRIGSELDPK